MAKRSSPVPPLVLLVLWRVYDLTKGRRPPRWIGIDRLGLRHEHTQDQIDAAVATAQHKGWLSVGGKPPVALAITDRGITVLKDRRMING
jgi:hypothetical protein